MKKTTRLMELFHRKEIFVLAGGGCALHARLAEAAGLEAAYMSGSMTSAHILGMPDAGLITMTEMVRNAAYMANAVSIPLFADADTGYGNAVNVRRTVQEFIQAGAAGIHLEDQVAPKRCGFVKGKEVISLEEAVGKYRAAVDAKRELDPDFVIAARTDARGASGGSLEEAIRRAQAYKKAGVDVVYVEGPQSKEEVAEVRRAVDGPLMSTLYAIQPHPTLEEMQAMGLAAAFFSRLAARAGYIAAWDFLQDFRRRGVQAEIDLEKRTRDHPLAGLKLFDLLGFGDVREMEEKYLPWDVQERYQQSLGLYEPGRRA
ncbi:MAG: isocitrate lyase/PEP mutase family protein [Chloroflexi bacterium]|nr:isocitrate lyase/PEP mutase family protein [Chloroflexota bacterium]